MFSENMLLQHRGKLFGNCFTDFSSSISQHPSHDTRNICTPPNKKPSSDPWTCTVLNLPGPKVALTTTTKPYRPSKPQAWKPVFLSQLQDPQTVNINPWAPHPTNFLDCEVSAMGCSVSTRALAQSRHGFLSLLQWHAVTRIRCRFQLH